MTLGSPRPRSMKDKRANATFLVTVKEGGPPRHTGGTCALHVMCNTAGARSTRRLMAVHPGASRLPTPPPNCLSALSRREQRARASAALASWMGTLYDNHHHFPSEDNTQGVFARIGLHSHRSIWCKFCAVRTGRMPLLKPFSRRPEASCCLSVKCSLSLPPSLLCTCATNQLCGCESAAAPSNSIGGESSEMEHVRSHEGNHTTLSPIWD